MGSKKLGRPQMRENLKNWPQMNDFSYPFPIKERQPARHTDSQPDRQTDRQTEIKRQKKRQRYDRQTDRETLFVGAFAVLRKIASEIALSLWSKTKKNME